MPATAVEAASLNAYNDIIRERHCGAGGQRSLHDVASKPVNPSCALVGPVGEAEPKPQCHMYDVEKALVAEDEDALLHKLETSLLSHSHEQQELPADAFAAGACGAADPTEKEGVNNAQPAQQTASHGPEPPGPEQSELGALRILSLQVEAAVACDIALATSKTRQCFPPELADFSGRLSALGLQTSLPALLLDSAPAEEQVSQPVCSTDRKDTAEIATRQPQQQRTTFASVATAAPTFALAPGGQSLPVGGGELQGSGNAGDGDVQESPQAIDKAAEPSTPATPPTPQVASKPDLPASPVPALL